MEALKFKFPAPSVKGYSTITCAAALFQAGND